MAGGVGIVGGCVGVLQMCADAVAEGFEAVEVHVAAGDALQEGAPADDGRVCRGGDDDLAVFYEGAKVAEEIFKVEST